MLAIFVGTVTNAQAQEEQTPAFPGAEGFGRYVTGGRGGAVYHVTNLNDSGTGSLRWAIGRSGAKTIVFDVSGTIHLSSKLSIGSNTTIAGQTAPGDGICVADYPCNIQGSNVIVRYMRFRLGNKNVTLDGADGWDGFGGFDQKDIIIDHCSVSWSIDECLSVLGNKNTTVQWCLVAQSLVNSGHSKGAHGYGGNWGGSGASFHHNLIAHHTSRTPRLGPRPTTQLDERMDMRNNVIYNYGSNGCYGGEGMNVNIVNNYYKPGPGTPSGSTSRNLKAKRIAGIGVRTNSYVSEYPDYAPALHLWGHYYVTGNVNSKYSDVTADNWNIGVIQQVDESSCDGTFTEVTKDTIKLTSPIPFILTTTHTAEKAYEKVLDYVGASLHRDTFDELMISDTRNGVATYTGSGLSSGFINSQEDNKPSDAADDWSAWPTLNSTSAPADTDGDGIPDEWENANGLNANSAADGAAYAENGYTNLENYLNSLVADITEAQYSDGTQEGNIEVISDGGSTGEDGKQIDAEGTVTWPFNTGSAGQTAQYASAVSTMLSSDNVTIGANLNYAGQRKMNNVYYTLLQPTIKNEASANDGNAVSFNFTAGTGYFFRPTNVSLKASRIGTDGGLLDISWKNGNGVYEIESMVKPERNNSITEFSKDISNIPSAQGVSSLVVNIYKLGSDKQIALAGIVVTGQVLSESTGVTNIYNNCHLNNAEYYTMEGIHIENPSHGVYIQIVTLPDGTRQCQKVLVP
ncbi:MAG: hypothetical protein K5893_09625 [Prevotella sp.]|nr:hypothetical protein [Prevotella sp.]